MSVFAPPKAEHSAELSAELPPAYEESGAEEILPPASLHIAGDFVYSDDPQAPPLYKTSHPVSGLTEVSRNATLERLDYVVKHTEGMPKVTTRERKIFELKHFPALWNQKFQYCAESASRSSFGTLGVATFHPKKLSKTKGYRVNRAAHARDRSLVEKELVFIAVPAKEPVLFEWTDAEGRLVAREVGKDDNQVHLVITAQMGRKMRDALVAAWLLRIWWELAIASNRPLSFNDERRTWNNRYSGGDLGNLANNHWMNR